MTGNSYTTEDLLNLNGVRQRIDSYKFELVDSVNAPLGIIQPNLRSRPVVTNDTGRTLYRTLEGFYLDSAQQEAINTESARVRPSLVLQNGVSFPLGVFLFADASRARRSWGLDLSASLVDQMFILGQPMGVVLGLDTGTNIVGAAAALAQEVITSDISAAASTGSLGAPLAWKMQDTRQKIINDLLQLVGFLPCYFDNSGTLIMKPAPSLPAATPDLTYEGAGRIVKDSIVESDDQLKAPNRYIVVDTGAKDSALVGAYDLPDSAPNSFANRGFRAVKVIDVQGLETPEAATLAAQTAAAVDPLQFRTVEFDSTHDPRHDTFNSVQLLGNQYREIRWKVELHAGARMNHSLRRVYA